MNKKSILALVLVVALAINMTACTIHTVDFSNFAADSNYAEVADFANRFATKLGKVMDLWRADINSLMLDQEEIDDSMAMMKAFVEGDYKESTRDEIADILIATANALEEWTDHHFRIFSNDADGQLNAEVIAQLCYIMRYMTSMQRNLFYKYLSSPDDVKFYTGDGTEAYPGLTASQKEYFDNTTKHMNILFSSGIALARANPANAGINLSDIRLTMVIELGRAVSKHHNYFIKINNNDAIDAVAFNDILSTAIMTQMYDDYNLNLQADLEAVNNKIVLAKAGITKFMQSLTPRSPAEKQITESLHAIQYRGVKSSPPTIIDTPPPSPPPKTATVIDPKDIIGPVRENPKHPVVPINPKDPNDFELEIGKDSLDELLKGDSFAFATKDGLKIAFDNFAGRYMADFLKDEKDKLIIKGKVINDSDMLIDPKYKDVVGNRPVFSITIVAGGTLLPSITGYMMATFPYAKPANEELNSVVVARNGMNVFSTWNAADGRMYIITDQITTYGYAYNKIVFPDSDMWAAEWIEYLTAREVIVGRETGNFEPYENVTRAEFVTMLARIAEADLRTGVTTEPFDDVPTNAWYARAVSWGAQKGVVLGVGDNIYEPDRFITREEIAAMIKRFIVNEAVDHYYPLPVEIDKSVFADDSAISDWANQDVYDMQQAQIMQGKNDNLFDPQADTNRAEAATCLAKLVQKMTIYFIEHAPVAKDITWS